MTNKLDKLIGNDELLTYICLILAILNTFLISAIITDTNHKYSIYIFVLFEALFLIFIVFFLLKKKDVYSKDDDIKYDWYFYLRVSIIILVFFNFALYIYNISKDPSINPPKNGGGHAFSTGKSNRVAPAAPAAPADNNANEIAVLQHKLAPLVSEYSKGLEQIKSTMNNQNSTKNSEIVDKIEPLRTEIEKINAKLEKLQRQGKSTVATTSRATERASRATLRASRTTERASRATLRESSASNRVFPVQFPYQ
jgi:outer membrane murein-binding lipoprotein Lpp